MGFRFRKSIKLLGSTKVNISHKSIGISAGVKGARLSINSKRGITGTVSIPGTGISYSKNINTRSSTSGPNNINMYSNKKNKDNSNDFLINFFALIFFVIIIIAPLGPLYTIADGIIIKSKKKQEFKNKQLEKEKMRKEIKLEIEKEKEKEKIEKEKIKIETNKLKQVIMLKEKLDNKEITQEMFDNIKKRMGLWKVLFFLFKNYLHNVGYMI